jgi:hypothetical protein
MRKSVLALLALVGLFSLYSIEKNILRAEDFCQDTASQDRGWSFPLPSPDDRSRSHPLFAELSSLCTFRNVPPVLPLDHESHVSDPSTGCGACVAQFGPLLRGECCSSLPAPTVHPFLLAQRDPYAVCSAIMEKKALVSGYTYEHELTTLGGHNFPDFPSTLSMTGLRRLNNMEWLLLDALSRNVPGDVIETGVWRGGLCVVVATMLRLLRATGRTTFLADSFAGIPDVNISMFPKDKVHESQTRFQILTENSEGKVANSLSAMGVFGYRDYPVVLLQGYFNDSLPKAVREGRFKAGFAIIRLDGDTYMSTWQAIEVLYPLLHSGGFVIVDDYTNWKGCFDAINDYREKFGINTPIVPAYHPASSFTKKEKKLQLDSVFHENFGKISKRRRKRRFVEEGVHGVWFRKP